VVGLSVELAAADAQRLPVRESAVLADIPLPRLAIPTGADPLPLVLAALATAAAVDRDMEKK
jgi:hypothetical protein